MTRPAPRLLLLLALALTPSLVVGAPLRAQIVHGQVRQHLKLDGQGHGFLDLVDAGDRLGAALAVLDVNGDGILDLALGAPGASDGLAGSGAVWLLILDGAGGVAARARLDPPLGAGALQFGRALASPGDVTGDGVPDLAVSGLRFPGDTRGGVWLLGLTSAGEVGLMRELGPPQGHLDDGWGAGLGAPGDVDGDGVPDLAVGAPGGDGGRGAVWLVTLDSGGGATGNLALSAATLPDLEDLQPGDRFGAALTRVGDLDGDGRPDLVVGAPGDADQPGLQGALWILGLGAGGTVTAAQEVSATTGNLIPGLTAPFQELGAALAWAGDLDGDGLPEVAVGAPGSDGGAGRVFVLGLSAAGATGQKLVLDRSASPALGDLSPGGRFGSALATAEGQGPLRCGAPEATWEASGPAYGRIYRLALGDGPGLVEADHLDAGDLGATLEDSADLGTSLALLGDLADDGTSELAVVDEGSGHVWLLSLDPEGAVVAHRRLAETSPLGQLLPYPTLAQVVAAPGDVDGDGIEDLALGLPLDAGLFGPSTGKVFLACLEASGAVRSVQTLGPGTPGLGLGPAIGDRFGAALAPLGDLDGNGALDLAVGAPLDDGGGTNRGAVWILLREPGGGVLEALEIDAGNEALGAQLEDGARFGSALAALGDLDGDGVVDLAVGADGLDAGGSDRGGVWVLLLRPDGTVREALPVPAAPHGATPLDGSGFGRALAAPGDLDGDGIVDLVAGVARDAAGGLSGEVWVLLLERQGGVKWRQRVGAGQGGFEGVLVDQEDFGRAVCVLGDLDGDGVVDLAAGSADGSEGQAGQPARGAAWLLSLRHSPWTPMGGAVTGELTRPTLTPEGGLAPGAPTALVVEGAGRFAPAWLLAGLAADPVPFAGGTLVPVPQVIVEGLDTGPLGTLRFEFTWPALLGSGTEFHAQCWIEDEVSGPAGWLATQGVRGRVP